MEVSGVVFRSLPCYSGAGLDSQSSCSKLSFASPTNCELVRGDFSNIRLRSSSTKGVSRLGFTDSGHLQYYVSPKAGLKKEKKKSEIAVLKKKLKLVKGMSKDLLRFSSMGFGLDIEDGLITEVKEKKISEAIEILLSQLQQLKAEEKELKRKKKEEKAKMKATQMNKLSSSSSSESSDSERGEIVDMNSFRSVATMTMAEPVIQFEIPEALPTMPIDVIEDRNSAEASTSYGTESRVMMAATAEKIEVCMGGKCKKSGAPALLEEFQQRVGIEGVVVGCRCMGKCRDGPNVRIVNQCSGDVEKKMEDCVRPQGNPLCIGVGLEDVGVIVSNFFGGERKELQLAVA
ncbi:hypothetical protein ACHQM5_006999 [Ranunculus cassubicifolius]